MSDHEALLRQELRRTLSTIELFSARGLGRPLRGYQLAPARAIVDSVLQGRGLTLAVMMARQAGKNEISAQVEALLLHIFSRCGGTIVKAAPTFRPQALNSLLRLEAVLRQSRLGPAAREGGYMLRLGRARAVFLSAAPTANVVGATADILLEADEAQDLDEDKWNKDFRPMAASTNATTVLWGTAWTAHTPLAKAIRVLRELEGRDQVRRVFSVPWQMVAAEVPVYGEFVRREIERLGPQHPLIRTQYALEELDEAGGLFPPSTQALMRGSHARQRGPTEGREYALLVDVAGEAEERLEGDLLRAAEPRRDATALTVVEVVRTELGLPRFLVLDRYLWTGTPHAQLYGAIAHLAELWAAHKVVVDATGVGAGLASFLRGALGTRLLPFHFTLRSKSDLGWRFLGLCNSGRFLDHREDESPEQRLFWRQVQAADYEVLPGPQRAMRWGVKDPAVHDDLLISAALCAALEEESAPPHLGAQIIEAEDAIERMKDEG